MRILKSAPWALVSAVLGMMGARNVRVEGGGRTSVDRSAALLHGAGLAAAAATIYSSIFLCGGRLMAVVSSMTGGASCGSTGCDVHSGLFPSVPGIDVFLLGLLAAVVLVVYWSVRDISVLAGWRRAFLRKICPKCGKKLAWVRALGGREACYRGAGRCGNCGTVSGPAGEKIEFPQGMNPGGAWLRLAPLAVLSVVAVLLGVSVACGFWMGTGYLRLGMVRRSLEEHGFSDKMPPLRPKTEDPTNAAYWLDLAAVSLGEVRSKQSIFMYEFLRSATQGEVVATAYVEARAMVRKHAEALDLLHEASKRKKVVWPLEVGKNAPLVFEMPMMAEPISLARLAALDAVLRMRNGDETGAARSVRSILAGAAAVRQEEQMTSQMISLAMTSIGVQAMQVLLPRLAAGRARRVWGESLKPGDVERAYNRSVVFELETMFRLFMWENSIEGYWRRTGEWDLWQEVLALLVLPRWLWRAGTDLALACAALDLSSLPHWEAKPKLQRAARIAKIRGWVFGLMGFEQYSQLRDASVRGTARVDLARAALAVKRYRDVNGKWPESLRECVGPDEEELLDVYTGEWLKLARSEKGMRIYSVGEGGNNDGGTESDIVWLFR